MMDWKRLLNPWGAIRVLETTVAILEDRCEEYRDRANEAEDRAFRRASEHYYQRSRQAELQNAHMTQQLATISSLQPQEFIVRTEDIAGLTATLARDRK